MCVCARVFSSRAKLHAFLYVLWGNVELSIHWVVDLVFEYESFKRLLYVRRCTITNTSCFVAQQCRRFGACVLKWESRVFLILKYFSELFEGEECILVNYMNSNQRLPLIASKIFSLWNEPNKTYAIFQWYLWYSFFHATRMGLFCVGIWWNAIRMCGFIVQSHKQYNILFGWLSYICIVIITKEYW